MAHAGQGVSFPSPRRDVPVVAFTTTRWIRCSADTRGIAIRPPRRVHGGAAGHEARRGAQLPARLDQLRGWVEGPASLGVEGMDQDARETWREYGELVYEGAAFETLY